MNKSWILEYYALVTSPPVTENPPRAWRRATGHTRPLSFLGHVSFFYSRIQPSDTRRYMYYGPRGGSWRIRHMQTDEVMTLTQLLSLVPR